MILAHSLAMNGGVLHAVESLTADELADALDGYRYFGLDAGAAVLREIADAVSNAALDEDALDSLEVEADERYNAVVADDDVLAAAFEERYRAHPEAFAPPG